MIKLQAAFQRNRASTPGRFKIFSSLRRCSDQFCFPSSPLLNGYCRPFYLGKEAGTYSCLSQSSSEVRIRVILRDLRRPPRFDWIIPSSGSFRDYLSVPVWSLKMGPIGSPETSVSNHLTPLSSYAVNGLLMDKFTLTTQFTYFLSLLWWLPWFFLKRVVRLLGLKVGNSSLPVQKSIENVTNFIPHDVIKSSTAVCKEMNVVVSDVDSFEMCWN
jgi:hypothetical protein